MYIRDFVNLRPEPKRVLAKSQLNSYLAKIDQYDAQDFNLNDCGFIRNDISQLMRAQSQSEYDAKMRTLVELPSESIPDDMSVQDALALVKPRYSQSPAELAQYAEYLANHDVRKMNDAYQKSLKDINVDSSKSDDVEIKSE